MNVWFQKFASCLAHVLLNPRQILIDPEQKSVVLILWLNRFFVPSVNPREIVSSAFNSKARHPNHCKTPAKVPEIQGGVDFKVTI